MHGTGWKQASDGLITLKKFPRAAGHFATAPTVLATIGMVVSDWQGPTKRCSHAAIQINASPRRSSNHYTGLYSLLGYMALAQLVVFMYLFFRRCSFSSIIFERAGKQQVAPSMLKCVWVQAR